MGALLLLAAALGLAHRLTAAERATLVRIEAYHTLLRRVRQQIACYGRSFGEICRRMDASLLSACGLTEPGCDQLAALVETADACLPSDAARVISDFVQEFGRGYLTEQLAVCDAAVEELEAIAAAARRRLPERIRLIRCACLCGGLAVILLLL